jgi:hypothetical protein
MKKKQCVLLKDSWHVILPGIMPEGLVYAKLHENSVPNIPHCSQSGDINIIKYHKSQTHRFAGKFGTPDHHSQLVPHQHYCLVLDQIGRRLEDFKSSWEMVNAVYASSLGELTNHPQFHNVA